MPTKIGVGESKKVDSFEAGREAANLAMKNANISNCDFCVVFSTVGYNLQDLISGIQEIIKNSPLIGCSGEGIITQSGAHEDIYGVGVMVFKSDEIFFRCAMAEGLNKNSREAGIKIGKELSPYLKENPIGLLLLADCLSINTDELFEGIENQFKQFIPIFGGTSFDNWQFKRTYQFFNDKILNDGVVAVLFTGKANLLIRANHGCEPLGIERRVTKAERNVIYEIDKKPALEVFKEYVGQESDIPFGKLITHLSFGLKIPREISREYDQYIIRSPMTWDEKTGAIGISAEIKENTTIQLVRRDEEKIQKGTLKIANEIKEKLKGKEILGVLHIDCAGRGKAVLGERVNQLVINPLQETLGKNIPWLGFHGGGEIAPIGTKNYFHNYTVVLGVFYRE